MSDRPIPRDWNSRVIWLMEHLLGGGPFPPGSGVDWPQGGAASPVLLRVRVPLDGSAEYAVQLPTGARHWTVRSFAAVRTAGSGTTWTPRLGQVAGWTAAGIEERFAFTAQGVGTPFNDVFCACIPVRTDGTGKLWFRPGFNAGVDNVGTAELWFQQGYEAEGSS